MGDSVSLLRYAVLADTVAIFILNVELRRQPSEALWIWLAALWLVFFVLSALLLFVSCGRVSSKR